MSNKKPTVGIIGYGSFGAFLARKLDGHVTLKITSRSSEVPEKWRAELAEVAQADYLIPSIPVSVYPAMFAKLQLLVPVSTVIVDVCSIKEKPIELITKYFPENPLLATHPLFGPESAEEKLAGHQVILCTESHDAPLGKVRRFLDRLGLDCVEMSAAEHDQLMAKLHALTFFVARGLDRMEVTDLPVMTPSYRKLVSLAQLEHHHSDDLFKTVQAGNRFARQIREQLLNELQELDKEIDEASEK